MLQPRERVFSLSFQLFFWQSVALQSWTIPVSSLLLKYMRDDEFHGISVLISPNKFPFLGEVTILAVNQFYSREARADHAH